MNRSIFSSVWILKQANPSNLCRLVTSSTVTGNQQSPTSNVTLSTKPLNRCLHASLRLQDEDRKDKGIKRQQPRNRKDNRLSEEEVLLQSAAIDAAQSLPGDWNRTANDLMSRLSVKAEDDPNDSEDKEPSHQQSSLLSTMKIGRTFERPGARNSNRQGMDDVQGKIQMRKRLARKSENFTSLYSQPRLGIFDADQLKTIAVKGEASDTTETSLWHIVGKEQLVRSAGGLPRNGFEEMIQWTKEGRMWSFPVDNEEDMSEERQYQFHQHIFLTEHLKDFPTEGPLRRFMDLVLIGLSKNPWISVPEKIDHIQWYADYFKEKQKLLETSIGDKAHMKQA